MIKIIFSDMDGTLLTSANKLPDGFDEMMAELKSRGVIFAPASGRQYFALLKSFEKYVDEFLFLAENGTLVMHREIEIFSSPIERAAVDKVLEVTEPLKNILRVWCGKKDAYIRREQDTAEYRAELGKYYTRNSVVDDFAEIDDTPIKVALFDITSNAEENIYKNLAPFYDSLQVVLSSNQWVDVMSPGINKGEAIRAVQRILDIKPEECAAFGDYMNDYEMIQAVGHGFAMANAHPELKKIARYETASNDQFGVIVGIKRLISEGLV